MRISKENTLGLIIDMQERLFPVMYKKEKLLQNCLILIKGLNALNIPTIFTQQYTKGLGETLLPLRTEAGNFSYIEKTDFSCCDNSSFSEKLTQSQAKNIIICGIESHVCVLQTAVDLSDSGFNPIIVMDCVSSRSKKDIKLAMERFRHENILITSYESILFELTRSASADEFRTISKLVK
jgi:nicotinamidase-related amidase